MTRDVATGVVGAGPMGRDIAGLLANAGYRVTLVDVDPDALESAFDYHQSELVSALDRAGLDPDDPARRIEYSDAITDLADCGFVVEALPERLDRKRDLLDSLETVLAPSAVVGTNTSSLTPGDIAAEADHPERVVSFRFANSAIQRDTVEISGDHATADALRTAIEIAESMCRQPVRLHREY